jgi:O-antigen/teichoic acid export membrane protein/glycosyltransferase involved in cell wall biosynthesis
MSIRELRTSISRLGRESWLLFVAVAAVNASNYVFHVVVSRWLGPSEYGVLGALLAILIVLAVPLSALQTTVARRVAQADESERSSLWSSTFRSCIPIGLWASAVFLLASPFVARFLHIGSWTMVAVLATYIVPAMLFAVTRGALQGNLQFGALAGVSVAPVLVRLLVAIIAIQAGLGVTGAVVASTLSEACGLFLALYLLRGERGPAWTAEGRTRELLRELAPVAMGLGAMWFLIELDLVMARNLLRDEAGEYAAAGMLARAALFIPAAVSMIALPRFAQTKGHGAEAHRWLVSSSAVVAALGLLTTLVMWLFGDKIMPLTFGAEFAEGAEVLPLLTLAMAGFGVTNLVVFFHIAAGSRLYHLLWIGAVVEITGAYVAADSADVLAAVVAVVAWTVSAAMFLGARSLARSRSLSETLPLELQVFPARRQMTDDVPDVSLVVPTFNGGSALIGNVQRMVDVLASSGKSHELIVVSDGCTDGSLEALVDGADRVCVVHYPNRQGKGVALRVGMNRARGRYVAFMDSDGELDASDLGTFLALTDLYDAHVVLGSKRHPLSRVDYPWTRRAMSATYHRLVRLLFGINVRDTQTGMKLIRRDVLDAVLPKMLEKRFAFDLEFLVVARRLGYDRFFEAPIKLNYGFESTVALRAVGEILLDTAAIYYRTYLLRYYDSRRTTISTVDITESTAAGSAVEMVALEQGVGT